MCFGEVQGLKWWKDENNISSGTKQKNPYGWLVQTVCEIITDKIFETYLSYYLIYIYINIDRRNNWNIDNPTGHIKIYLHEINKNNYLSQRTYVKPSFTERSGSRQPYPGIDPWCVKGKGKNIVNFPGSGREGSWRYSYRYGRNIWNVFIVLSHITHIHIYMYEREIYINIDRSNWSSNIPTVHIDMK